MRRSLTAPAQAALDEFIRELRATVLANPSFVGLLNARYAQSDFDNQKISDDSQRSADNLAASIADYLGFGLRGQAFTVHCAKNYLQAIDLPDSVLLALCPFEYPYVDAYGFVTRVLHRVHLFTMADGRFEVVAPATPDMVQHRLEVAEAIHRVERFYPWLGRQGFIDWTRKSGRSASDFDRLLAEVLSHAKQKATTVEPNVATDIQLLMDAIAVRGTNCGQLIFALAIITGFDLG